MLPIDEILRDTDETLGKLTAIVSDFNNFEESRHAYLLYITMIGLECIELVELKFIYLESEVEKKNIENRKNEIIKEAIIITEKLINESWRKTNGRFRLVMNQFSEYYNYEFDGVRQLADHSLPSEQVPEKERDHVKQIFNEYAKNFIETRKKLFLIAPDNTLKKFASKKGINPPFSVKNGLYRILT